MLDVICGACFNIYNRDLDFHSYPVAGKMTDG